MTISRGADDVPARRWEIFISHSSRDSDSSPTANAGVVLKLLCAGLGDQYKLLIDENFEVASEFEKQLWPWTQQCDAAFVLLDEKALASKWVQGEVTALMLRRNLEKDFSIWPVLIGLSPRNLEDKGKPFSDLLSIQATVLPGPSISLDDVGFEGVVDKIIRQAKSIFWGPPRGIPDAMWQWIQAIANLLPKNSEVLKVAAGKLGIDGAGALTEAFGGRRRLATQFVNVTGARAELDAINDAMLVMKRCLIIREHKEDLAKLLAPVWVGEKRVRSLPYRPDQPHSRNVVLLPASEPRTARHYVDRASRCAMTSECKLVQASGLPTGELSREILVDVQSALDALPPPMKNCLDYLIIPPDAAKDAKKIIDLVHSSKHGEIIIIALTGANGVASDARSRSSWEDIEKSCPGVINVIKLDGVSVEEENDAQTWVSTLVHRILEVDASTYDRRMMA